jgi:23S rRNA (adenine2503-C2)-methyltransferase
MKMSRDAAKSRYAASLDDIGAAVASWSEPAYRARQLHEGLFAQRRPLEALTNVSKSLRERAAREFPLALTAVVEQTSQDGQTAKWLWSAAKGAQIETVLMEYPDRATVCVSSQAGCAMGCTFCATGQAGFERHLDAGEIVEQVLRAQHASSRRVSNVVFMGMGEPLANVEPVLNACTTLNEAVGISARHITVSTVGVIPGIDRLADFPLPVTLAVSLHAADDDLRETMVPLNRRYPVAEVVEAARRYADRKGRRVTFEYACIAGVNDDLGQADALGALLTGLRGGAHVNLIPLNPTAGFDERAADLRRMSAFARRLEDRGVHATIRRNRGVDIDAACGQLRARSAARPTTPSGSARMRP